MITHRLCDISFNFLSFFFFTVLPTSSKHKLQALAKDELLASLNVPLTGQEEVTVSSPEEAPNDTADEQEVEIENAKSKKQGEKERRETKRLLIMEEVLETEKNYISCLETLNAVSFDGNVSKERQMFNSKD